ncbi:hypothetical protein AB4167_05460 [Vibrio sp. 10N.286.49.E11]|uniref:AbiU2 domain-containing protein n=1 Tax=Vibrio TaxID=662 RepID=UPI000362AFF3|nr:MULTISPECIES: hypothetical protein [Vibrio]OED74663.1 hypothetical protein A141_07465 [Vibrio crassostreae ZF-91]PMO18123.1 hypothetical protein BCT15_22605 [Vibrio splendidus]TKG26754.1 hypothetical protein FCV85_18430 [Vibrio sp. F13]
MNKETEKILNDLKLSIDEAARHREIWWELGVSENRTKFKKEFESEEYNYYLHASYEAHSLAMLLALGRIFDNDSRSSSIRSLKDNLTANGHTRIVDIISQSLHSYSTSVQKVLDIRSKIIAHTDMRYDDRSVLRDNSLSPDEIKDLIFAVRETYYVVLRHFFLNTKQHPDGSFGESAIKVLTKLQA